MDRKSLGIIVLTILLGALIFTFSPVGAQRDFRTEPRQGNGHVARYQVVNVTDGEVIIMDVTTGDLYSAKPSDVKPYSERPRPNGFVDKPKDDIKDKDVPKETVKDTVRDAFRDKKDKDTPK